MATKVKLRLKPITGNRKSLYLDFYPAILQPSTGEQTRREFLGFYLFDKPKTPVDKQHNKETLQLAEQVRQKRDKQLNENEALTDLEKRLIQKDKKEREHEQKEKVRTDQNFVAYFKKLASKRKASNHDIKTTFIVKY